MLVITGSSVLHPNKMRLREQDFDGEEELSLKISSLLAGEKYSKDDKVCEFMFIED